MIVWGIWWLCRARELFYYLKGGQVDYGVEHSQVYGHTRFGRIYETGEDLDEQNITVALSMASHEFGFRVLHFRFLIVRRALSGVGRAEPGALCGALGRRAGCEGAASDAR